MIKKNILQWKPMELGCIPQKMDKPSLGFHGLSWLVSKNIVSDVPRNYYFFFHIVLKKCFFKLTEGYPHDRCRRTMRKTYFATKTNGIRWCSSKKKWIFPLRLIFYVCSSARNRVSSMYKGIDQFPLGSSDPGCLKFLNWRTFQEKKVPWNDQFLFILFFKNELFNLT